jgi:hypothetical protein
MRAVAGAITANRFRNWIYCRSAAATRAEFFAMQPNWLAIYSSTRFATTRIAQKANYQNEGELIAK